MSTRTLVIGLDAATWDIIEPLREQGALPNIGRLIQKGGKGVLKSTNPPMTPLAWTSMATGVNPGKHGIYDFVTQNRNNYQIKPIDYSEMSRPAIWDLFNKEGQTVGVINFPMVNPPEPVDDFFISGIPTPDTAEIAHPSKIQEHIDRTDFRIHPRISKNKPRRYFEEISELTDAQCELSLKLAKTYNPDLLWTVFMGLDWGQHYLWDKSINGQDAVETLYQQVDDIVGKLTEELDSRNVLLASDHGAGSIEGEIHLNSLLKKWGYLSETTPNRSVWDRFSDFAVRTAWLAGRSLPPSAKQVIRQYLPHTLLEDAQRKAGFGQYDMHESIHWERTAAFSYGAMGRLFLHTESDYPEGTVSDDDVESLREELICRLEELTHPETGEQLVDWAAPSEEIYDGPLINAAPDILFATNDWQYMIYCDFGDEWIHPPHDRIADHKPQGMYVFAGEDIEDKTLDAKVTDITPTLLHLHGLPVLEGMDGEVLTEILSTDNPIETVPDYEKDDRIGRSDRNSEVTDRLEDLGYL